MKLNAFTWIIITLAVTAWVFILPVKTVACLLVLQLILLLYIKRSKTMLAAIGGLGVFTGMMIALQLLFGSPLDVALFGGLRMLVMTLAFLCMLATTKIQSIAKALVERFHMPVEYAFMLTTALRFVPNFLEDSTVTLDAQSCRGYSNRGNALSASGPTSSSSGPWSCVPWRSPKPWPCPWNCAVSAPTRTATCPRIPLRRRTWSPWPSSSS